MAEKKEEMMEEVLEDLEKDAAEKQAEEVSEAEETETETEAAESGEQAEETEESEAEDGQEAPADEKKGFFKKKKDKKDEQIEELNDKLKRQMAEFDNFEVVQGDVLALDLAALCREKFGEGRAVACANLPYYITTPAITALMESGAFEHITVMVQKEVAERICAAPGTSAYSAFSIYVQYHAKAEILFDVPADCFVPRPKVDSAVLKLTPLAQPAVETRDEKLFFALVRAAFNMRRKTLVNALGPVLASAMSKEEIVSLVEAAGLDARIRGERLSLADYAKLADLASEKLNKG